MTSLLNGLLSKSAKLEAPSKGTWNKTASLKPSLFYLATISPTIFRLAIPFLFHLLANDERLLLMVLSWTYLLHPWLQCKISNRPISLPPSDQPHRQACFKPPARSPHRQASLPFAYPAAYLLLHGHKELLDAFKRKLIMLHPDPHGVIHELARHFQDVVGLKTCVAGGRNPQMSYNCSVKPIPSISAASSITSIFSVAVFKHLRRNKIDYSCPLTWHTGDEERTCA